MSNETFFRRLDEYLPEQAPPPGNTGPVKWLRENLFSGPVNSVATVLIVALFAWIIWGFVSWFFLTSTFHGETQQACRMATQATLLEERLGSLRSEQRRLDNISGEEGSAFDDRRFKAFVNNLGNLAAKDIPKSYADILKNEANVELNNAELAKFEAAQAERKAAILEWIEAGGEGEAPGRTRDARLKKAFDGDTVHPDAEKFFVDGPDQLDWAGAGAMIASSLAARDLDKAQEGVETLQPFVDWGKANSGACHAVFKKNYWQLLVNAYDRDQLWRPILVALLLIPVLAFVMVPRLREGSIGMVLGISTGLFPFVAFFVLSGAALKLSHFEPIQGAYPNIDVEELTQKQMDDALAEIGLRLSRRDGQWVEGQSLEFVDQWSVRLSTGEVAEVLPAGFGRTLYGLSASFTGVTSSETGRLLIAAVALAVLVVLGLVIAQTRFGRVARPFLRFLQFVAGFAIVIAIWGTVINNPHFEHKRGLLDLTEDPIEDLPPEELEAKYGAHNQLGRLPQAIQLTALMTRDPASIGATQEEQDAAWAEFADNPIYDMNRDGVVDGEDDLNADDRINATDLAESRGDHAPGNIVFLTHVPVENTWGGILITMILGLIGSAFALRAGILLALGRQSTLPVVRYLSTGFIEGMRGVPLITILIMSVFVLPLILPIQFQPQPLVATLVAVCLFGTAYMAEVIRGGLQAIPKGQYEAAQSLGLSYWQETNLIIVPQATRTVIPAIVNTLIGLFKDTTLVIVIGLLDVLTVMRNKIVTKVEWNQTLMEGLIYVAIFFFIFMFGLSRYSMWLEERFGILKQR
ncbi:MAG: amino acid ABC transporter permease [Alphaproteobacteria bacterium]